MEKWKPIIGYTGLYEVSSHGRVRRLKSYGYRLLRPGKNKKGYLQVCLSIESCQTTKKVHRLVAEAFIPNPENKPQVNHKDGNKEFNFKTNLEWVTNKENIQHSFNVLKRKASYGNAKLTKKEIKRIRKLVYKVGCPQSSIAALFNIHRTTVSLIKNNKIWK